MLLNFTLVFTALVLVVGLGIDAGLLEGQYMQQSAAARGAACAASIVLQRINNAGDSGYSSSDMVNAGKTISSLNGYTDGANGVSVSIQYPPPAGPYANNPLSVRAVVTAAYLPKFLAFLNVGPMSTAATWDQPGAARVDLSSSFNRESIVTDGSPIVNGGADKDGYAYSATYLGSVRANSGRGGLISWRQYIFILGPPNQNDSISGDAGQNIPLTPTGNYSRLLLLGASVNGPSLGQVFTVTYSDGSTTSITQDISDWCFPANRPGEDIVFQAPYRNQSIGSSGSQKDTVDPPDNILGYAIPLDNTRTPATLTMPNNSNVILLAANLEP